MFGRTALESPLRSSAFEGAKPDAEVGDFSLESQTFCLGRQGSVLREFSGLPLDTIEQFPDEDLQ